MNKLLTTIVGAVLGATMTVGVGVAAVNSAAKEVSPVHATESTYVMTIDNHTSGNNNVHWNTANKTLSYNNVDWVATAADSPAMGTTKNYASVGTQASPSSSITLSTSDISGTIKSVSVFCASYQGKHSVSISVGGTTYLSNTATATWSNETTLKSDTSKKSGTGSSSGEILLTFTGNSGKRAFYIYKVEVVYEVAGGPEVDSIDASLKEPNKIWKKGQSFTTSDVSVYVLYDDLSDETITNGVGVKFGASANLESVTLVAGTNTIIVNYGGQTDTVGVFGKAPTGIDVVTSSGSNTINLNANGNSSISDDLSFEVEYNTSPVTTDYAATLTCASSGWAKTADDDAGNITITFESNGTFNFVLASNDDAEVVENLTYVVTGIPTIEYELFSGNIEEGKYLITVSGDALKNTITSNRGDYAGVTPVNNKVSTPAPSIVWQLEESGDYWTIYNAAVNKYFSSTGAANKAQLLASANDDKALWTIIESSSGVYHFTNKYNDAQSVNAKLQKNGSYGFACYAAFSDITLYKLPDNRTITDSRITAGTVSASTGDTEWTLSGFKFEVQYNNEPTWYEVDAEYEVSDDVPTINADGTMDVTVTGTFKGVSKTSGTIAATLVYVDQYSIQRLYSYSLEHNQAVEGSLTFDGIFMGYITRTTNTNTYYDLYIGSGNYGMMVYGQTASPSSYTEGSTYLTVTGTLKNFNGLYEMTNATVSVLNDATRKNNVSVPSIYVVTGEELATDKQLASRKTSLAGVVSSITPSGGSSITTPGATGTEGKDNSVFINVGGTDILLYVKSAQLDEDILSALAVGKHVAVEGWSTFHNGFQVSFVAIIEADTSYHAADFARDLLKLTMGTCNSSYDGITNNHETLTSIWTTLAGADHWLKVEANSEEDDFLDATANSAIVVPSTTEGIDAMSDEDALAAAAYRYDYCTAKYSLTNFTGRSLSVSFSARSSIAAIAPANSAIVTTMVVISLLSLTTIGGYFLLRKKKED